MHIYIYIHMYIYIYIYTYIHERGSHVKSCRDCDVRSGRGVRTARERERREKTNDESSACKRDIVINTTRNTRRLPDEESAPAV